MASVASTWSAQDLLVSGSRSISILASLATLWAYSLIEEEDEHDLMEASRDWVLLTWEDVLPLSVGLFVLGIERGVYGRQNSLFAVTLDSGTTMQGGGMS